MVQLLLTGMTVFHVSADFHIFHFTSKWKKKIFFSVLSNFLKNAIIYGRAYEPQH